MSKLIELIESSLSVTLATIDAEGHPFSSYAPFVRYEHEYYIFISQIAKHAANLLGHPKASLFFIEDESKCENIFARKRVSLLCDAEVVARETPLFERVIASFEKRFDGEMVKTLCSMQDFTLFKLRPLQGEAVFGFGKAYDVGGVHCETLLERKQGQGHRR